MFEPHDVRLSLQVIGHIGYHWKDLTNFLEASAIPWRQLATLLEVVAFSIQPSESSCTIQENNLSKSI
jgi:hypothetical protein